jgi:hypothetical protein
MLKYCITLIILAAATSAHADEGEGFGSSEAECKTFAESVCRTSAGVDQECFTRIYDTCRTPVDND